MRKSARLRDLLASPEFVLAAGAHNGIGAVLTEQAGFHAVWASSFEISAAHALPDASLLTMTDYLRAAQEINRACEIPVLADCDTGFGSAMNVAYLVREYEAAGIAAICLEDKLFPKVNSFADHDQQLADIDDFAHKIWVAKSVQATDDLVVIARTEAFIAGRGVAEALRRACAFADAGADAILVHSKAATPAELLDFLDVWDGRKPVIAIPTTYYNWHPDDARKAGVAMFIYANHGIRASVRSVERTLASIRKHGTSAAVEDEISAIQEIFRLQRLNDWLALE